MPDPKEYRFETTILKQDKIDAGFIEFPFDVLQEFGKKGQVKVKAYFDGFEYRGSLVKMGHHCHIIGLNKKVREAIGKSHGDRVEVVIMEDLDERTVSIPDDLAKEFSANPDAANAFEKLSFSHRKEYVEWINSAKRPETRSTRIGRSIEMLIAGNKEPHSK